MIRQTKAPTPKIDSKILRSFQKDLLDWYRLHQRPLPWRQEVSPYRTVVSEFMCQQTQIVTVLPYFARWMQAFPDWFALASAPESDVLKLWEGLGYYRRARNLQALARILVKDYAGKIPHERDQLLKLPGIGPYTAGAVASIAFQQPVPVLDGNVERVLTRVFAISEDITRPSTKKQLWLLAETLLNKAVPGDYNQALMELGALICTPTKPQCLLCPLKISCQAPDPESFPVKARTPSILEAEQVCLLFEKGKLWLTPPDWPGRWPGFHRLPLYNPATMHLLKSLGTHRYSITKYRVTAEVWAARWRHPPKQGLWADASLLQKISLPTPHRKMILLGSALFSD
jgi:A/G-specific adenine glycosylase